MEEIRDKYLTMINNTFEEIQHLRNQPLKDDVSEDVNQALSEQLFDYGGKDSQYYKFIVRESENKSKQLLYEIIAYILSSKLIPVEAFDDHGIKRFIVDEDGNRILYILKDFGFNKRMPLPFIKQLLSLHQAVDYMYVSLVWDYAYAEVFNKNDNEADPSRGVRNISVSDFLSRFISLEEVAVFKKDIQDFSTKVKSFIGLDVIRTLQPITMYKFKRYLKSKILNFDYDKYLSDISESQRKVIEEQYFGNNIYTAMVSRREFAESFITAEWLYDSFENAGKIDYTVVALGYFKAIEQLLWRYVLLHRTEEDNVERKLLRQHIDNDTKYLKTVKTKNGYEKIVPEKYVPINNENIKDGRLNTSLGPMINSFFCFYKNNDLIRKEINTDTIDIIYKLLRSITPLRNGYFHKHNLVNWTKVKEARSLAFVVAYIILGAFIVSEKDADKLRIEQREKINDYYKLCEYMMDYPQKIYYMDLSGNGKMGYYTCSVESSYNKFGECSFGKVTLNEIEVETTGVRKLAQHMFTSDNIPKIIYSASLNVYDAMDKNGNLNFEKLLNGEREMIYNESFCAADPDASAYQY